ncbi:MAG: hypothetical protein H0U19_14105 [Acidobacteria bacterium]|nr:hypothetical protein [Acidobacteriota bacterium]
MTHLDETELIELFEGGLGPGRASHVETCGRCRTDLASIRSTFEMVAADTPPEPSPLFWDHFGRRVNERIDAPVREGGRRAVTGWLFAPRLAALVAATVLVVAVAIGLRIADIPAMSVENSTDIVGLAPASPSPVAPLTPLPTDPMDDIETDAAWAVVRTAAEDMGYDEARREGLAARPESAERVAMELSADERAELARLIESELKRTGA